MNKISLKGVKYVVAYNHNAYNEVEIKFITSKEELIELFDELQENGISYECYEVNGK
jgi:hypothetical protein